MRQAAGRYMMRISMLLFAAAAAFLAGNEAFAGMGGFSDTQGHWAADHINAAAAKSYVDGYPDGSFRPDVSISRAEFVAMLSKALRLKANSSAGEEWYSEYAAAVKDHAIYRSNDFQGQMDAPITREEVSALIARSTSDLLRSPENQASGKILVYDAVLKGLIQGADKGKLQLTQSTTRAEAITMIERVLSIVDRGAELEVDRAALIRAEIFASGTNTQALWNTRLKQLPFTIDAGGGRSAAINQLIVLDMDDPDAPYSELFPEEAVLKADRQSVKGDYLVAVHFRIENTIAYNEGVFSVGYVQPVLFQRATLDKTKEHVTTARTVPPINHNEIKSTSGWYLMTVSKEKADAKIKELGYMPIQFQLAGQKETITLNDIPEIQATGGQKP